MTKRTGVLVLSIFGAILGISLAGWMAFGPDAIRIPRDRIQSVIDEKLPFERDNITVANATVSFEGNEVVVSADVAGERLGQSFSLSAMTIGQPIYRGGSFYFVPSNVILENVVISENTEQSITDRLKAAADRYLPDNEGARNLVTDLAPEIESWLLDRTIQAAETFLSRVPIYTLPNDTTGIAAKAVLGEVFVENGELVITFTLWRLTWWVLMAGLMCLTGIAMIGAMIRNPGMFVAGSIFSGDF